MSDSNQLAAKSSAVRRDWTQGNIVKNLWSLSWPMLLINTINSLGSTIDMVWVGKLGADAIAGVGVSGMVVMVINAILFGLFIGTMALVARFTGARDQEGANRVSQQAFVVGVGFSLLMALVGILFSRQIMQLMHVGEGVVASGEIYLRIQLVGIVTLASMQICQSIMQASGDAINPLKISIGYRLLQIALCPALVFGWQFFPSMGVSGAAWSNIIAQAAGAVAALWLLFSGRTRIKLSFKNFRFDFDLIWRTLKVGLFASLTFAQKNIGELIIVGFISPFGVIALAAHSLSQRIDQFLQNLSAGMGNAGGVLAGQNLGAGQPERAEKTGWYAVLMASAVSLVCAAVLWFLATPLLSIFSSDSGILDIGTDFLKIQMICYLVWGVVISISLILNGVGDTMITMITNLVTMLGLQVGLAYYLPNHTGLGVYGVRWAIVIGVLVRAVIYPVYFKTGLWKRRKV